MNMFVTAFNVCISSRTHKNNNLRNLCKHKNMLIWRHDDVVIGSGDIDKQRR